LLKGDNRDGLWIEWYENGQKKSLVNYSDGKLNGDSLSWYDDGREAYTGSFKNDKKDGIHTAWYKNRQTRSLATFHNGIQFGNYNEWFENGQKKVEGFYKNGNLDGKFTTWNQNGMKLSEVIYADGKIEGISRNYPMTGKWSRKVLILRAKNPDSGSLIILTVIRNLRRTIVTMLLMDLLHHGMKNGNRKSESVYVNGNSDGAYTEWHENGKIKTSGAYQNGKENWKMGWIFSKPEKSF